MLSAQSLQDALAPVQRLRAALDADIGANPGQPEDAAVRKVQANCRTLLKGINYLLATVRVTAQRQAATDAAAVVAATEQQIAGGPE